MTPSYGELLRFASTGRELRTIARGLPFRLERDGDRLLITPSSTGEARRPNRASVEGFLARHVETRGAGPFADVSFDSSYLRAIIAAMERG